MSLDLGAIKARVEAATLAPWSVGQRWIDLEADGATWLPINSPSTGDDPHQPDRVALIRYYPGAFQFPHADARADAEFIASARTDVPALVTEVERLTAELRLLTAKNATAELELAELDKENATLAGRLQTAEAELAARGER